MFWNFPTQVRAKNKKSYKNSNTHSINIMVNINQSLELIIVGNLK